LGEFVTAPEIIKDLVKRFDEHRDTYRSGKYNETQLRREFLDPFFEALGWDVFNKGSYAETYKDVIHEDSLEIEGENKAPDYAIRIGGIRKFFVEAKKPAVNIEMIACSLVNFSNPIYKMPQEKESLQREIEATDVRIDRLVYELYGLSEEEIKIVES